MGYRPRHRARHTQAMWYLYSNHICQKALKPRLDVTQATWHLFLYHICPMAFILGHVVVRPRLRPRPCHVALKLLPDLGQAMWQLDLDLDLSHAMWHLRYFQTQAMQCGTQIRLKHRPHGTQVKLMPHGTSTRHKPRSHLS